MLFILNNLLIFNNKVLFNDSLNISFTKILLSKYFLFVNIKLILGYVFIYLFIIFNILLLLFNTIYILFNPNKLPILSINFSNYVNIFVIFILLISMSGSKFIINNFTSFIR